MELLGTDLRPSQVTRLEGQPSRSGGIIAPNDPTSLVVLAPTSALTACSSIRARNLPIQTASRYNQGTTISPSQFFHPALCYETPLATGWLSPSRYRHELPVCV